MSKKTVFMLVVLIVIGMAFTVSANDFPDDVEIIEIEAWTLGPDNPAIWRSKNLIEAVDRLNLMYEAASIDKRVVIEEDFWTQNADDYTQRLLLGLQSDDGPDILQHGHTQIGRLASSGYLLPLNEYKEAYSNMLGDVYDSLWETGVYKGDYYGVPQDTEARMVYFRRDMLEEFGYSDSDIEQLKADVESGEFDLYDMAELAKEVKDAGIANWGVYHRPPNGIDWFQWYLSFGGEMVNVETGELIYDRNAYRELFQYYHDLVHKWEITPESMTDYSWSSVFRDVIDGETLFYQGGSWNYAEMTNDYGWDPAEAEESIDFFLQPKGNDHGVVNTMSHPQMYMINADTEHPDIVFQILALASAPELNTLHAVESAHIAIRESQIELEAYQVDEHLAAATDLMPYSRSVPNHPDWPRYQQTVYESIAAVQQQHLTPEEAVDYTESQLQRHIDADQLIIQD